MFSHKSWCSVGVSKCRCRCHVVEHCGCLRASDGAGRGGIGSVEAVMNGSRNGHSYDGYVSAKRSTARCGHRVQHQPWMSPAWVSATKVRKPTLVSQNTLFFRPSSRCSWHPNVSISHYTPWTIVSSALPILLQCLRDQLPPREFFPSNNTNTCLVGFITLHSNDSPSLIRHALPDHLMRCMLRSHERA